MAPASVSVTPGSAIVINYVNGTMQAASDFPPTGPYGYTTDPTGPMNDRTPSGVPLPSKYAPQDWPICLVALMGTFADANGVIIGTPFAVGSQVTKVVPAGAARLLLGINDDRFYDNSGSLVVEVSAAGPQLTLMREVTAVRPSFSNLKSGTLYNLQLSGDAITWTNHAVAFATTNTSMIYPEPFAVGNFKRLFFRLRVAP